MQSLTFTKNIIYSSFRTRYVQYSGLLTKTSQCVRPTGCRTFFRTRENNVLSKFRKKKLEFEVDTAVKKDTVIYKTPNSKNVIILLMFGTVNCLIFWSLTIWFATTTNADGEFVYPDPENSKGGFKEYIETNTNFDVNITTIKDKSEKKDVAADEEVENSSILGYIKSLYYSPKVKKRGLILTGFCTGALMLLAGSLFSFRNIYAIILRKGGEHLYVMTFSPILVKRTLSIPVRSIACKRTRANSKLYHAIKVRGYPLYFLTDTTGKFHPQLYDHTVLFRKFK